MEEKIKNIEIEVSINHDLNEANFILAPKSAKNLNEIYAAHLEEKIGNQIKTYKEDVECALEIVRNSEAKIDNFEKIIDKSKENSSFAQEKVVELQNSLTSYAKCDLENLTSTGNAHFDNKFIKRAGDTMTGALTIQNNSVGKLRLIHTELDTTVAPIALTQSLIGFYDKNNVYYGAVAGLQTAANSVGVALVAKRTVDDEAKQASLNLLVDSKGETYFSFPMCDTQPTTTSTASENKVAVVVANYRNGASWYRVWSDGWIEQGGSLAQTTNIVTITLLKPFKDTNYQVLSNSNSSGTGANFWGSKTTTSFTLQISTGNKGTSDWRACGY